MPRFVQYKDKAINLNNEISCFHNSCHVPPHLMKPKTIVATDITITKIHPYENKNPIEYVSASDAIIMTDLSLVIIVLVS